VRYAVNAACFDAPSASEGASRVFSTLRRSAGGIKGVSPVVIIGLVVVVTPLVIGGIWLFDLERRMVALASRL